MNHDTDVIQRNPGGAGEVRDARTDVLRHGAQQLLTQAIESEVAEFLARHREMRDPAGRQRLVRKGYLPPRTIQTGIGAVPVNAPRVRDRAGEIRVTSSILPPYLRRTKTLKELLPWLYLKGISTGEFGEALTARVGPDAPGLSAGTISRLKAAWQHDHACWERRDLGSKHYVYLWVDGIHFGVRVEEANQCILVVIGATAEGKKELLALTDGFRESEESWNAVLQDLKRRGLTIDPRLAIGDGALGFWTALPQVYGHTRTQRCWVHKTANVLNKLPTHLRPQAKHDLQQIWMASTREHACQAFETFCTTYAPKYPKAAECLAKDQQALLAFYDFPAEHWHHLRTTNPIESTFASVRLRTAKTRGCVSRTSILSMVFMLAKSVERRWLRLRGTEWIAKILQGVQFKNGVAVQKERRQEIAA